MTKIYFCNFLIVCLLFGCDFEQEKKRAGRPLVQCSICSSIMPVWILFCVFVWFLLVKIGPLATIYIHHINYHIYSCGYYRCVIYDADDDDANDIIISVEKSCTICLLYTFLRHYRHYMMGRAVYVAGRCIPHHINTSATITIRKRCIIRESNLDNCISFASGTNLFEPNRHTRLPYNIFPCNPCAGIALLYSTALYNRIVNYYTERRISFFQAHNISLHINSVSNSAIRR